ncbi:MAG: hypothetical protein DRI44_00210 [Chlamydiae bacterium]|nr:MAG: hypothetical protein DRI44_00210 [Chlamydiota bacterium]
MNDKKKKTLRLFVTLTALTAIIFITGCTYPTYQRHATYNYDGNGKLLNSTVTVGVVQKDPDAHPLLRVFKNVKP